ERLLRVRIELALGRDLGEPFLRECVRKRAVHEADAILELRLIGVGLTELIGSGGVGFAGPGAGNVRRRELERTLEIVEHRNELAHQPLVGARGQLTLVARNPLAVVVELGLQPLERVEIVVALLLCDGQLVDLLDLLLLGQALTHRRPRTRRPRPPRRPRWSAGRSAVPARPTPARTAPAPLPSRPTAARRSSP